MAFQDADLSAEIFEIFADAARPPDAASSASFGGRRMDSTVVERELLLLGCYHVVDSEAHRRRTPEEREHRLAYMRQYAKKRAHDEIKARLLAGERPRLDKCGQRPTRWIKIAQELGIALEAS